MKKCECGKIIDKRSLHCKSCAKMGDRNPAKRLDVRQKLKGNTGPKKLGDRVIICLQFELFCWIRAISKPYIYD